MDRKFTLQMIDLLLQIKKAIGFFLFLFLFYGNAQIYPVQVTQSFIPPYNTKLSTYATSNSTKLNLQLLLSDIREKNRQVKLKLYIEGQGINAQSSPVVVGAPSLFLNGGVPNFLTNLDLKPYFELNNLVGIAPSVYSRSLPDGMYKICWEVYDYFTNQAISIKTCTSVYLLQNDPPLLNLPQRAESIVAQSPLFINFQWTPRHVNATNVSYVFELRELWDHHIDAQAAYLASPTYYTETTYGTSLLYDISKPPLLAGKRYAWRVKAVSSSGISENSVFKNDGYSEIFYFTYNTTCLAPLYTFSEALGATKVKLTWQGQPSHNKYHVQYKKSKVEGAEWFDVFTYNSQVQLSNLEAGARYDFRVGGTCSAITDLEPSYTYSSINQFTMPTKQETVSYNCGVLPDIAISNTEPLSNIGVNESFMAGDFPVTVKEIEGSDGVFSGVGFIVVPYLADTKIAVEFRGIKINTDYQLFDGVINTTYDPNWEGVESSNEFVEELADIVTELLNLDIDKATKENIEALAEAILENLKDENISEEIKNKINAATQKMVDSKKRYDDAITSGDTETAAKANEDFENAQEELKEVKKELDELKENAINLLKKAIQELYREGRDNENVLTSTYDKIFEQITSVYKIEDGDFFIIESVEAQTNTNQNITSPLQKELNDIEQKIGIYLFAKILSTEETNSEKMTVLINKAKEIDSNLLKEIDTRKKAGQTDREIIDYLKEKLRIVFTKFLVQNITQY